MADSKCFDLEIKNINALWETRKDAFMNFPRVFPKIKNPLEWALGVASKDPKLISTAMKWVFQDVSDDDQMMYVSRGHMTEETRKSLIEGVRDGAAIQLQVNNIQHKDPLLADFIRSNFQPTLRKVHPFGFRLDAILWITGAEHSYNTHCDTGDGFLFQLSGRKIAKIWGPKPEFYDQIIFNHDFRRNPELFEGEPKEVELKPGEVLFMPRGMMHEISVPKGKQSVSLTIQPKSIYPIVNVCNDLCDAAGDSKAFSLPDHHSHWDKFRVSFFDPTRFASTLNESGPCIEMPTELKEAFLEIVLAKTEEFKDKLPHLLDQWWKDLSIRRNYSPTGVYPVPPPNRAKILKEWEEERLRNTVE